MNKVRQFTLLTVVAVVVLFAAGYLLLVKPKAGDVTALEATAAQQKSRNVQLAGQIKMLNEQAKKLPAVDAEIAAIARQLPANPEMPALIRAVTASADEAGLAVTTLAPETPTLAGAAPAAGQTAAGQTAAGTTATAGTDVLAYIPVEIKIRGGYHNMQLFFANLESLPRSFVLQKFEIKEIKEKATALGKGPKPGDIDATLTGRVFMAVPASSLPVAKAPTAADAAPAS